MMGVMEGFKRLFADDALSARWLRNAGMSGLDRLGFLKHRLMRQAMGLHRTESRR
jgi:2-octaprenylphenol hydroxylase